MIWINLMDHLKIYNVTNPFSIYHGNAYSKFPGGGKKQGLKNGPVRSILVDHLSTGPDHGLDHFFLDRTAQWTAPYSKFPGGGQKQGLKNGPLLSGQT